MGDLSVNETGAATVALAEVWRQLAPLVDEAKRLEFEASRDPDRLRDRWVVAHVRWLTVFEREIAAVQKVHETMEAGARLSHEDVRAAREAGEKLLSIIEEARERVRVPEAV